MTPENNPDLSSLLLLHRGKVGDVYNAGGGYLLLSRSDRVSGLNAKLLTPMPHKGKVLNQLSNWWMGQPFITSVVRTHLTGVAMSNLLPPQDMEIAEGRATVVKKLKPILIEAVVRRHLTGSGYEAYLETGKICGITLPLGLKDGDRLWETIFTPTDKSATDPHITFAEMSGRVGDELAEKIREVSLAIFEAAEVYLLEKGIILADTKFEFGLDANGNLVLMDEALTPDSSRFWLRYEYEVEGRIVSLDKQKIRDWLKKMKAEGKWDGISPIALPEELVSEVSEDYVDIFRRITGKSPKL